MASVKDWVALGRPHTAALTMGVVGLGAWLGGARDWHLAAFLAWALLFHWAGFTLNNILDVDADRRDPEKRHFPLVSGTICESCATLAYLACMGVVVVTGVMLAGVSWALAALVVATLAGILYNERSKKGLDAPLWIMLSLASLPLFSFLAAGGSASSLVAWYVVTFVVALAFFNSVVLGYWKDLATDPVSWLRVLGASARRIDDDRRGDVYEYVIPERVGLFMLVARALAPMFAVEAVVGGIVPASLGTALLAAACGIAAVAFMIPLTGGGTFSRSGRMRRVALTEVFVYVTLVASLAPALLPWSVALAFVVLPLAWFVALNRYLWGAQNWLAPRV